MKLQGKVVKSELEGGVWTFEDNQGKRYQIQGGGKDLLVDGQRATITGEVAENMMGIGMMGPILVVERYQLE